MFMVSFQARYETPSSNKNLPQAIFLANTGDVADVVDPHRTQPHRPAHYTNSD